MSQADSGKGVGQETEEMLLEAQGTNGRVQLFHDRVRIKREGFWGNISGSDKDIPIHRLSAAEFRPAKSYWNGHIQFVLGGVSESAGASEEQAKPEEYQVVFTMQQSEPFERMKNAIEQTIEEGPQPAQTAADQKKSEAQMSPSFVLAFDTARPETASPSTSDGATTSSEDATKEEPTTWASAVVGLVALVVIVAWIVMTVGNVIGGDEAKKETKAPAAGSSENASEENSKGLLSPAPADYPKPLENSIKTTLVVSGSEGGAYAVREVTWEDDGVAENFGTIFNLGEPDLTGTLPSRPVEHVFDLDDGVYKDAESKLQWDSILITVDKMGNEEAGEWEGALYAKLYANGELVDCGNTDSGSAIRFEWSPPDGAAGIVMKGICSTYPGF